MEIEQSRPKYDTRTHLFGRGDKVALCGEAMRTDRDKRKPFTTREECHCDWCVAKLEETLVDIAKNNNVMHGDSKQKHEEYYKGYADGHKIWYDTAINEAIRSDGNTFALESELYEKQAEAEQGTIREHDSVNYPKHYTQHPSGVECIQVTSEHNFCIGNAIKYLWRAGLKEDAVQSITDAQIQDLEKAIWYISYEVKRLKKQNGK